MAVSANTYVGLHSPTGITPAAYASGDVIGAVTEIPCAVQRSGGTGVLQSLIATDKTNTKGALDIIFFSEAPANSIGADNAAYALNDADVGLILGRVSVAAADWVSSGSNNAEATKVNLGITLKPSLAGTKSIWFAFVARDAVTPASVTSLQVKLGILQD